MLFILGYFIFGYIVTMTKIALWRKLILIKASLNWENIPIHYLILCFLIFPYQFLSWRIQRKNTRIGKYFPIIPVISLSSLHNAITAISINTSVVENLTYYTEYDEAEDEENRIYFNQLEFEKKQFLSGVFLGVFHLFGYIVAVTGYLILMLHYISKFLYNKILEPFMLFFFIK
jgi:hypothetical protein